MKIPVPIVEMISVKPILNIVKQEPDVILPDGFNITKLGRMCQNENIERYSFIHAGEGPEAYQISDKIIGKGAYAQVKLGNHISSGKKVAFKIYDMLKCFEPNRRRNLKREV